MPGLEMVGKTIEFYCASQLPYGHPLTILEQPRRSPEGWVCVGSRGIEGVTIVLAEWLAEGKQLIIVSRQGCERKGYRHIAVGADELEAASERLEEGVCRALAAAATRRS